MYDNIDNDYYIKKNEKRLVFIFSCKCCIHSVSTRLVLFFFKDAILLQRMGNSITKKTKKK